MPESFFQHANPEFTYIFEYVGPDNLIVTPYPKSELILLGIRHNELGDYKSPLQMESFVKNVISQMSLSNKNASMRMVKMYKMDSFEHTLNAAKELSKLEEGFVCWDLKHNLRVKIKSPQYVALHQMNSASPSCMKDIIKVVVTGETDEVLSYFPELQSKIEEIKSCIDKFLCDITKCYDANKEESNKEFATIVKDLPHSFIYFSAKKKGTTPRSVFEALPVQKKVDIVKGQMKSI